MREPSRRRYAVVVLTALLLATGVPSGVAAGQSTQEPGPFLTVIPPGQDGSVNVPEAVGALLGLPPPHLQDQLDRYEAIVYADATPGMTEEKLLRYYKQAPLTIEDAQAGRVYRPGGRTDVVIRRDARFGVPHIEGETREGVMYAQGYATAEDRLFLMDVLRRLGRAEVSLFLGPSPGNLELDREQLTAAPYTEADLQAQIAALAADPEGARIVADLDAYQAGVNRYIAEARADDSLLPAEYALLGVPLEDFVREDAVATGSLVTGIFATGGGREVENLCGLQQLEASLGSADAARAVFDDFKFADDAEAPVTASGIFPYLSDLGPVDPAAVPTIDCGSLQRTRPLFSVDRAGLLSPTPPVTDRRPGEPLVEEPPTIEMPHADVELDLPQSMSNALLVAGDRTTTGTPIAVMGPQTGYFMPQLLVEKAVVGPGIEARGVGFAGIDFYVQLGNGADYAWSATSASADNTDQFVLRLCERLPFLRPSERSMGYRHNGRCKPIESSTTREFVVPTLVGLPDGLENLLVTKHFERAPEYGPLLARGRLQDGTPIAIASRRSTYGAELDSARAYATVNDPEAMAGGFDAFRERFVQRNDGSFNWFYIDRSDIGYQLSCKCPQRAQGVDPYLPAWGTGQWDWVGEVPRASLPQDRNPEQGYLSSWNNKQARGFLSNDGQFGFGPIHRSDLLDRRIEERLATGAVDRSAVVDVAALAATTDLRGQELVGLLDRVLGEAPAGVDPRAVDLAARLRAWSEEGSHRRDHDRDGRYEHAVAIAAMDAWWPRVTAAMFGRPAGFAPDVLGIRDHDPPQGGLGSAFQDSLYAHVHKDLRQVLGDQVADPWSRAYCGDGDLGGCRTALWNALGQAVGDLEAEFGTANVAAWQRRVADDAITHDPLGIVSVRPIHWQNRPTFQQVVQLPPAP